MKNHNKLYLQKFLIILLIAFSTYTAAAQKSAPALNLFYSFPSSKAIVKMNKVKIVQSANTTYCAAINYDGGYAGLQQTPDGSYGNPNIMISSLWDPNTQGGVLSRVDYTDAKTVAKRFDWEGSGCFTINPIGWKTNIWYNIVLRAWKSEGRLFIATFINDESTSRWLHSTTLSIPFDGDYLSSYTIAFLENWDGANPAWNGSVARSVYYKDCWNLNLRDKWEKNTTARLEAYYDANSVNVNGIYINSFNGFYDTQENAYCLQHGGNTTPSAAFNGGRVLGLPSQAQQGTRPSLTVGVVRSVEANYNSVTKEATVSWTTVDTLSPQLSAKIEILDALGRVKSTYQDTLPQRRSCAIRTSLGAGNYSARVSVIDIFNQQSNSASGSFSIPGSFLLLSPDSLNIPAAENSTTSFEILSNTNWNVRIDQSWLALNTSGGSNNATVTLNAEENSGIAARTARVTVSGSGVDAQTVIVTQERGAIILTVSVDSVNIGFEENSTASFDIVSNTSWSVTSDQDWLIVRNPMGSNNSTLILIASENPSLSRRTAWVTVSGDGVSEQNVRVIQEAGSLNVSSVNTDKFKVFPNPASKEVFVYIPMDSFKISVYDSNGQKMQGVITTNAQSGCLMQISTPGVYWLSIVSGKDRFIQKLIITGL